MIVPQSQASDGEHRPVPGMGQARIYEQVVERIRELLDSGALKPGDRLPPERTLAELFTVSRSSVREAIRALQENGVLESRRGAGTFVTLPPGGDLLVPFAEAMTRQRVRLWQFFQFRRAIEPQIARLAAENRTPEQLTALAELLRKQEADPEGPDSTETDMQFHQLIAVATGNPLFVDLVVKARGKLAETRTPPLQSGQRRALSLAAHQALYDAIATQNANAAECAMRDHLLRVEETLFAPGTEL